MPCDLGERKKTGWGASCCCLCFWKKKPTNPPSCLWDLRHAGRHLYKPHQLSITAPRLCKLGRPEWDTVGMSSYLLFIKINWLARDVCGEFISSSCTSKCPKGEGAEEVGRGEAVWPPAQHKPSPMSQERTTLGDERKGGREGARFNIQPGQTPFLFGFSVNRMQ